MIRKLLLAVPALAMLAACGPANDIVVTNDNNVVLNREHEDYASINENEVSAENAGATMTDPANGTGNMAVPTDNGATPD